LGIRVDHWIAPPRFGERRRCVVHRNRTKGVAFAQVKCSELSLAEARRVLQHGLEHRLEFTRRAGDDAQHLRGRRLLLQCLGKLPPRLRELAGAHFELLFQLDQ
jgi:hypothetical protein